ncbi:MAG TPA: hypothetical protein VFL93_03200 [Longimicrobiaceae bacterium]|nr:hypothetical protein [Longimicrobiaceae bacterium]
MRFAHRLPPLLAVLILGAAAPAAPAAAQTVPAVAPADLSQLTPAQFADSELDIPYYLAHFARLANSVRMSGPTRGFIDLSVWRNEKDNRPYNARVMENILSLAYFYATDRPWNPYRGNAALRARLEAALEYWTSLQSPEGRFSEYGPGKWNLAATAFATKFMGQTLHLLHGGPPIDTALYRRVAEADRKTIMEVLDSEDLYARGHEFANQYTNVWAGALAYLDLFPDAAMRKRLEARIAQSTDEFQSPVGYFYEEFGPDWSYNLGTHHSNLMMAWNYTRGTPLGEHFVQDERRFYDWFAYNAALEPDGSGFTMNASIETRHHEPFVTGSGNAGFDAGNSLEERVEMARVLGPSREELAERRQKARAALELTWPRVDSLAVGTFSAFSPYAFLHRDQWHWYPSEAQRRAAIAKLPYLARDRFTHQRMDSRRAVVFTFVRRPAYYAAFNSGELWREQQRYGLGLLWVPGAGSFLQSQTGSGDAAWGTRAAGDSLVYEARSFTPSFRVGGRMALPTVGARDLPAGDLDVAYALGDRGRKTVSFRDDGIHVSVQHPGAFVEQIPLLVLPTDSVVRAPGRVVVRRGGTSFVVTFDPAVEARVETDDVTVGRKRVTRVAIPATGRLRYTLRVESGEGE